MNRRQVTSLVLGVVVAHFLLFWWISGTNPLPKTPFIPPPTFIAKEASWVDKDTGEHVTYHEYQVSTKLAMPDALMVRNSRKQ